MHQSKNLYKNRIIKLYQQVINQNLIIKNQSSQIANFVKKTFEIFQFAQLNKMLFNEFLVNYRLIKNY